MSSSASRSYFDALEELVVILDADDTCLYVNDAYCRVFLGTAEEWQGKPIQFSSFTGYRNEHSDEDDEVLGNKRFESMLTVGEHPMWVEWQESQHSADERIFIGRDITQRKLNEEALQISAKSAEAGNNTKMRFLATMSHEMRTPLNGILGMTGLLMDSGLDANQSAYADAVRESGNALLALINDILDYSKIDAEKVSLEEIVYDPISLVQSVTELLSPRAAHKGLEIASFVHPSVPRKLIGDEARLRQVLLNLAGNGVKFTEEGGVTIELDAVPSHIPGRSELRIDVRDTGVGIAKEDLPRMFEEFAQADGTHARKYEGTGLGLAIARRIVNAMGGELTAQSKVAAGSVFSFSIPLKKAQSFEERKPSYSIGDAVVVVTGSKILKRTISLQLESAGVKNYTITAKVEDATNLLRKNRNAVLLCDLPFAAQHGSKLTKEASHSLVMLSPVARGRLEAFRKIGFHGYLIKPIRQSSLLERLSDRSPPPVPATRLDSSVNAAPKSDFKFRILLAEDNQINAVLATAIIKRAGHHVDVAGNGVEALELLGNAPYDLVLMDMHMPEMDGLTASRKIRQLTGPASDIPIIALTANAMQTDRHTCIAAGMNDFLTKPFEPADLIELIERWAMSANAEGAANTAKSEA